MRSLHLALAVVLTSRAAGVAPVAAADRGHPTVVELFTHKAALPLSGRCGAGKAGDAYGLPLSFSVIY